jgi:N utilization substance protein B
MAGRRKGRTLAFQAIYAWEISGQSVDELVSLSWLEPEKRTGLGPDTLVFTRLLIMGVIEKVDEIDSVIKSHLKNWDFNRLGKVDLALLRLGVYSMLFQRDVAPSIIIDEMVEISKDYGTDDSFKFINGVLDAIRKSDGSLPSPDGKAT